VLNLCDIFNDHQNKAEQTRLNATAMFFSTKKQRDVERRQNAVLATYQEIIAFMLEHQALVAQVKSKEGTSLSGEDIKILNGIPNLMLGIIYSFRELDVEYCCLAPEHQELFSVLAKP
jgi:hypothetical protein